MKNMVKYLESLDDEKFVTVTFKQTFEFPVLEYLDEDPETFTELFQAGEEYDIFVLKDNEDTIDFVLLERSVVVDFPKCMINWENEDD